jgi:hypothetical protein
MVITHTIICSTCKTEHLLKITLGRERAQAHVFPCTNCDEEIKFGLEGLPESGEYKYIKNCEYASFGYDEAIQVLLHPGLSVGHRVVQAGDISMATRLNVEEMVRMSNQKVSDKVVDHRQDFYNFGSEKLRFYLKIWSLLRNGQNDVARYYADENAEIVKAKLRDDKELYIVDFLQHFIGEYGLSIYGALQQEWSKVSDGSTLTSFHLVQDYDEFEIFEEFFDHFSEFSQIFMYLNNGIKTNNKRKMSSTDFNKTKKYYSSAYEALAKRLYIPAGINNLNERGDANSFQRLASLSEYMATGNGDKLRCLEANVVLSIVSYCYDNNLRNASFHNQMKYNAKKSKITYTKNNKDSCSISYQDYLSNCVKVSEALAAFKLFSINYLQ